MRKTKIVCTMGPAVSQDDRVEALIEAGMNVARLNFSHGSHAQQKEQLDRVVRAREKLGKYVAILLDTKGPEVRIREMKDGQVSLQMGQEYTLVCGDDNLVGDENQAAVTYEYLYEDIKAGTTILLDDGLIGLTVLSIQEKKINCRVENNGVLKSHKGVNIPGVHIRLPYLSEKDRADILFGIENQIDYVAASFVRSAVDVNLIRNLLDANGGSGINIIAKIENKEGVDRIDEIIEASDAIMIARGDMGVELPAEEVPILQKMIIKKVYEKGKQVIIATQMLDSMMEHPRATRAETADVANAVYEGASAVMLSGETAAGKFPVEALETMVRIVERTEADVDYVKRFYTRERHSNPDVTDAIGHATCTTAYDLNAAAIVTVTKSGRSARMISRYRPYCKIIAGSTSERVCRQLSLAWGIMPIFIEEKEEIFELFDHAIDEAKRKELLREGDIAVINAGVPLGVSGNTNMIKVVTVE
ncbi:MAG: pyruvate kinase [Lachnospiraceae bacterium]|nr:pyruvate kinase [Lachnospiraceae bacterium]